MINFNAFDVVSLFIEKDTETAEHCGAGGMFQVIKVIAVMADDNEIDITENIDQGKFYTKSEDVAVDLGINPQNIVFEE